MKSVRTLAAMGAIIPCLLLMGCDGAESANDAVKQAADQVNSELGTSQDYVYQNGVVSFTASLSGTYNQNGWNVQYSVGVQVTIPWP